MESTIEMKYAEYPTLALIRRNYDDMPKGQQRIADYILTNPSCVEKNSISELARCASCKSDSSIVRFYRSLGFKSYKDFRLKFVQELAQKTFYHSYEDIHFEDTPTDIKRKIFNGAMLTLNANANLDDNEAYEQAIRMIMDARRIVLLGYAASAVICYYAHFRFLELGLNCHFSSDAHINAAILTEPAPDDLFMCVSMSGETRDIVAQLQHARSLGAKVIALTGSENSSLCALSDVVIFTSTDETIQIADAMNARLSQLCTVDALFAMISIAKGEHAFDRLKNTRKTFKAYRERIQL